MSYLAQALLQLITKYFSSKLTPRVNGAALGPYHPAVYDGPEPKVDIEGSKTYYGSCYCHKVKTAVKIKPLDETYDERVTECNCSICRRVRFRCPDCSHNSEC